MIKNIGFIFNTIMFLISSIAPLQGMQQAVPKTCGSLVLSLALYNRHLSFDHDDICSFALVNKESKKTIQKTAKERKNHLNKLMMLNPHNVADHSPLTWDKHGSMCVGKQIHYGLNNHHHAEVRYFVFQNNKQVDEISFMFPYHPCPEYQALFNNVKIMENEACYYDIHKHESHVYEYSFFRDSKYIRRECMVKINNEEKDKKVYPLIRLVDFPSLFAAVFNACVKEKNETQVIFDLNSAIIPDNFRDVHPGLPSTSPCSFEKSVISDLQNAIIQHYQGQQKK